MKAQTKALLASVVVIALALSAVSGITYSWWSDSEQAEITVNTGYVDVTTSGFSIMKGGVPISGTPDSIPSTMGITFQDSEESTAWDSSSSSLMIRDDTSEVITITYAATFSWSVASKYNMDFETTSVALDDVTDMTIDSGAILRGEWMHVTGTGTRSYNVVIEIGGLPSNLTNAKVSIQNHITQEKSDVGQWSGGTTEPISLSSGGQYLIYNASQLAWVAQQVNGGYMTFKDSTVKLMDNIDLGGYEWEPIGNAYDTAVDPHDLKTFQGIFDGNGKAITGLNVDISSGKDNNYAAGLFGWFGSPGANAKVENLVISGARVSGHHDVGGIVGYLYDGAISDCTVKDSVITNTWEDAEKGGDKTGGIVGYTDGAVSVCGNTVKNVSITGCRDLGMISGTLYFETTMENNCVLGNNSIKFSAIDPRDSTHSNGSIGVIAGRLLDDAIVDSSNVVIGTVDSDSNSPESLNTLIENGATNIVLTSDVNGTIGSLKSVVQRNLEIDLNGKTLTTSEGSYDPHDGMGGRIYLVGKGATLTIKDGKMNFTSGGDYAFLVYGGGKLILDSVVISTTGNNLLTPQTANSSAEYGHVPSEIIIRDSTLSAKESVFYVGTGNQHHSYVTIENSDLMVTSDGIERDSSGNVTGHHNVNVIRLLSDVTLKMVSGSLSVDSEYGQALHTRYGNDVVLENVQFKLHNQSNAVAVWGCGSSIELIDCSTDSLTNFVLVKIPKTLYKSNGSVAGVYETDYKSNCFLDQTYFDGTVLTNEQKGAAQGAGVHLS